MYLKDAQKKHSEEKYNIFMKVCENFQPVFRYFCMEKFLDPAVWFEKRLAYTRSVATSSIGIVLNYEHGFLNYVKKRIYAISDVIVFQLLSHVRRRSGVNKNFHQEHQHYFCN